MKLLLLIHFLLLTCLVEAQKMRTTFFDLSDYEVEQKTSIPFCNITVIDARFDRSNIGSVSEVIAATNNSFRYGQTTASFPDSLNLYLPQLLKKLFTLNDSKDMLVLLIKQFRISDHL